MDGLAAAIPRGALVGIDASPFIYHIEENPAYVEVVARFFGDLELGRFRGVSSVITLMEIAVGPLRGSLPEVADEYELLLLNYPNLRIADVDRRIVRRAAELRALYRLRPPDSLQLATALEAGASLFVTNDRDLRRVAEIEVLLIDDYRSTR